MPDEPGPLGPIGDESTESFPPANFGSERIGPYKVLQKIGEGGMGVVYLAEQEAPLHRRVALKVIKPGMDSKQVLARFEAERQALAVMNHPGVARVFDAGSTSEGRPYFVMEHVAGIPITEFCDKHLLDNRQRLHLFVQVCDAIQHAHQKGIIHRDIKPSNVLVAIQDGKPVPKVIDFGVAKAIQQQLTEQSLFTQQGVLIGTPEYMSPEQAEMNALDIDTRSDVYALGVLLYELLVGALPFETRELRAAGLDGMLRMIREQEPPKPSARLISLGNERSSANAKRRHVDARTLRRQLSGDLDWVTLKALEKDRSRRYGSPAELAADIQRHLVDEPVIAGPPRATYRLGKAIRRHRLATVSGLAVVLALAVALLFASIGYFGVRGALNSMQSPIGIVYAYNATSLELSRAIGRALLLRTENDPGFHKSDDHGIVVGLNTVLREMPEVRLVVVVDRTGRVQYTSAQVPPTQGFSSDALNTVNKEFPLPASRRRRFENGLEVRELIVPILDSYGMRIGTLLAQVNEDLASRLDLQDAMSRDFRPPKSVRALVWIELLLAGVAFSALVGVVLWSRRV